MKATTLVFSACFMLLSTIVMAQFNAPESVEYDPVNNRYFVANSGNGEILSLVPGNAPTSFVTGVGSGPHGLEVVGNTLYVCSGGSLKGYDVTSAAQVVNANLNATFLNGITSDGSSNLYITDFSAQSIIRYDVTNDVFNTFVASTGSTPNGIIYDGPNNRLVFVSWGNNAPIKAVSLADSSVTTLTTTTLDNIDGIAMNNQGQFYVSSWGQQDINRFENDFVAAPVPLNVAGLTDPADLYYNLTTDTLAIPSSGSAYDVTFIGFNTGVNIEKETGINFHIEVAPNPADEYTYINYELPHNSSVLLKVFDANGRLVRILANESQSKGQQRVHFDTSELTGGIYYYTLQTDYGENTGPIAVTK